MKEALDGLEKAIRSEFKLETDAKGLDLVKQVASNAQSRKLGEDEVKVHPLYLSLEEQAKKQLESAKAEFEKQFGELKTGYERKDRFGRVSTDIQKTLESLRPVLPTNPAAAATVRQEFIERFSAFDFDLLPDGKILVMRDGKRVEDAHGHPVLLSDLVKREAEVRFDFHKQSQKESAGNDPSGAGGAGVEVPKNAAEFQKRYFESSSVEERQALKTAYEAANPA
jgi:hypothetical protein